MLRALVACLLVATLASPALAASDTVAGAAKEYQAADRELNTIYKTLTTTIEWGPTTKKQIVQAELAWIKFRDAEAKLAGDMAQADGEVARWRRMTELTRERTKTLRGYIDYANGD